MLKAWSAELKSKSWPFFGAQIFMVDYSSLKMGLKRFDTKVPGTVFSIVRSFCCVIGLLTTLSQPVCEAFNLDERNPTVYSGPEGSFFGYAVDFYLPDSARWVPHKLQFKVFRSWKRGNTRSHMFKLPAFLSPRAHPLYANALRANFRLEFRAAAAFPGKVPKTTWNASLISLLRIISTNIKWGNCMHNARTIYAHSLPENPHNVP